ncbi:hypothetical protein An11g02810 [Aspergillus niger]|uniref:Uncharacterized protein n=2 Tax=Aspergillus niger TaxID=5061 RepID=A2QVV9_ASPNC|nr:hypothetical protein An11g02810 [Aspergillus niger]CAK96911.1 hypothetical protein An11g02810 [Aspergillus niger]
MSSPSQGSYHRVVSLRARRVCNEYEAKAEVFQKRTTRADATNYIGPIENPYDFHNYL